MKTLKNILYGFLAVAALGFSGCQDDFDTPAMKVPVAANADKVNTTIAQLKEKYWQDETNYCEEVGTIEDGEHAGEHYIIRGRVISSDYDGNIFKCLYIQDETAAIALSINQYNLYMNYRQGQEVVIDATGMFVGKYNGMQQFGFPEWYDQGNCWETSFMAPALFNEHTELNGLPEPEKIDTLVIKDFGTIGSSPEELRKFQGQLVRFNNCQFANPGTTLVDEYHSSGYNQPLNVNGGTINVRTSGYARFWNMIVPEQKLDVVGILSYYGTSGWQLLLNDANGLMNIGNPTENAGAQNNPYKVEEVIDLINAGQNAAGWVTGYIAGAVAPAVTEVTSNDDIEWGKDVALNNTLVIAPTADCKEYSQCLIIELPDGSSLREFGNLLTNPDNYGKQIWVSGNFGKFMGTYGVLDNAGSSSEWKIDGVTPPDATIPTGDGQKDTPFSAGQVISGAASGTSVWVSGYIVGWIADKTIDTAEFNANATIQTNLLIADSPDETDITKCVPVQLPAGAVRTALNLQSHPENYKQKVSLLGSVEKYFGQAGVKTVTEYVLGEGGSTPVTPPATGDGDGSDSNPFTIGQVIAGTASGSSVWVEGYIVGWIADKTYDTAQFNSDATIQTNLLLAATPDETDLTKCIPIQLPAGTVRTALNLQTNPGNYKKQVKLKGSIEKYFGQMGVKTVTEYVLGEGGSTPVTPPATGNGDGSDSNPFTIGQVIAGTASGSSVWVEGYIVGWIADKTYDTAQFNSNATIQTNLLLAATPDETDLTKCIPIQLPAGTVRTALNLQTNPGNYKKQVKLKGSIEKYFGQMGVKTVTEYVLGEGGSTPVTPPATGNGDGTESSPYTIADVLGGATGTGVWVDCYVVGWIADKTYDTAQFNADATIKTNLLVAASASETDLTKCVPVQLPNNDVRTALNLQDHPDVYKKHLLLKGNLEAYFGQKGVKSVTEYKEL